MRKIDYYKTLAGLLKWEDWFVTHYNGYTIYRITYPPNKKYYIYHYTDIVGSPYTHINWRSKWRNLHSLLRHLDIIKQSQDA